MKFGQIVVNVKIVLTFTCCVRMWILLLIRTYARTYLYKNVLKYVNIILTVFIWNLVIYWCIFALSINTQKQNKMKQNNHISEQAKATLMVYGFFAIITIIVVLYNIFK